MKRTGLIARNIQVGLVLLATSLICFWETLPLGFFSDDYYVLHRLTIDKIFWAPGFFRPLSDLSLLFSYETYGYNAFGYRLFNVLLHTINGFLLYKTSQKLFEFKDGHGNKIAAFLASVLFVTYPFHTEPVIWIVGRASLIASTFGILSLYSFFSGLRPKVSVVLSCLCYFIGLTSYESILVIPAIIFLAVFYRKNLKQAFIAVIPYAFTLLLHVVVRLKVAGIIAGSYGKDMFEGQTNYLARFIKSFARLFVPASHSSVLLIVSSIAVFLLILLSFYVVYKFKSKYFSFYILLWLFLLVAHIVPGMFGVDTHTSDGDRLLYFPSYFLCAILGSIICLVSKTQRQLIGLTILLLAFNIYFLKKINGNWIRADAAISDVLNSIRSNSERVIYFANMPEAIEGSFAFRNGFYEALEINKIQSKVQVLNYLRNKEAVLLPDTVHAKILSNGNYRIPPFVTVSGSAFKVDTLISGKVFTKYVKRDTAGAFLFWNKNKVVLLLP